VLTRRREQPPTSWSKIDLPFPLSAWVAPYMESLITGDVVKYGPRGTNEYAFELTEQVPEKFLRGQLAKSWEVTSDPLGVIFHLRQGIMWTGNANIGMEPREFTADDAAFCLNTYRAGPYGDSRLSYMEEGAFKALDRYTLQVTFTKFNCDWAPYIGYAHFAMLYPPEEFEAGDSDWRNQVGTGAFILTKYVTNSHATYIKNPDWWDSEKIIDGKAYDTPFIDKLIFPVMLDKSTQIAALRTGSLDVANTINMLYEDTLASTNPDLILHKYRGGNALIMSFMCEHGPLADKNLRRALWIGTDQKSLVKTIYTEGDIQCYPWNPGLGTDTWTSIEDLPPSARELFMYDPEKAKQMIIDAGYPEGLTISLDYPPTRGASAEIAPLVKDMWAKIGVDLILQPREETVVIGMENVGKWDNILMKSQATASQMSKLDAFRTKPWMPYYYDEYYCDLVDKAMTETDAVKRDPMIKELATLFIDEAVNMPTGNALQICAWWPWVKNYYGETESAYDNYTPMISTLWIDQVLKAEMGY